MEREAERIRARGALILAVGPGSQALADRVKRSLKLSFAMFGDPGVINDVFGFRRVAGLIQQSGTVLIDREGVIRFLHGATNPGDSLPLEQVWDVVEGLG